MLNGLAFVGEEVGDVLLSSISRSPVRDRPVTRRRSPANPDVRPPTPVGVYKHRLSYIQCSV